MAGRAALAAAAMAALIVALFMAWPLWPSLETWGSAASRSQSLAATDALQKDLLTELEATRRELQELQEIQKTVPWYADDMGLNYRSPWPPAPKR
jgi:hypothetical protein